MGMAKMQTPMNLKTAVWLDVAANLLAKSYRCVQIKRTYGLIAYVF
jgi:hypothetical protein